MDGNGAGRIDVHAHSVPKPYRDALIAASGGKRAPPPWSAEAAIEAMDRDRIAVAVTSIAASWTFLRDAPAIRTLARQCNDASAELVARRPRRFGAFAAVPLPDPSGACAELRHAFETLKLDGAGLFSNYGGRHLGDPLFDPVLEMLNDYEATVFIHPTENPANASLGLALPPPLLEFAFDTTRLAVNLVISGALDRFPKIKFILAHAGGTLPFLAWRVAHLVAQHFAHPPWSAQYRMPILERNGGAVTPALVMGEFRRFWYDTALAPGRETFGSLVEVADPDRILFGTDWPYAPEAVVTDAIDSLAGFLDAPRRQAIERGNALPLFPRLTAP